MEGGKNLHSKIYMPVILLCIQLLSPHVKGETLTLSHVIMGFLKWHSGSKKRKKGCPDQRSILPGRTVGSGSVHALFVLLLK